MAFITLEDRYGDIECIAFAGAFSKFSHLLRVDNAVAVLGNISLREDEAPKLLISGISELIENSEYKKTAQRSEAQKAEPQKTAPRVYTKLFLRVPDMTGEKYKKAYNISAIFEGSVALIFYDTSSGKYISTNMGVDATDYVIRELVSILGEENVVLK